MPRSPARGPILIGIDTGGTFTDFVALARGRLIAFKLPSTPVAPERAVLAGLARLAVSRSTRVRHGSTVATNTLLERKGARVALVTTEGFRDTVEIRHENRFEQYDVNIDLPPPLVPRRLVAVIRGESARDKLIEVVSDDPQRLARAIEARVDNPEAAD